MYVAMLLTDWYASLSLLTSSPSHLHPYYFFKSTTPHRNVVKTQPVSEEYDVYIGRSEVAMWMRVVSSWVCIVLYMWSLLAPVLMPDR